jgi:hypothetical protein
MRVEPESPQYDHARRRRALRSGREKGCWVYIPEDELRKAGIDSEGERPWYRVWAKPKRTVLIQLYEEP